MSDHHETDSTPTPDAENPEESALVGAVLDAEDAAEALDEHAGDELEGSGEAAASEEASPADGEAPDADGDIDVDEQEPSEDAADEAEPSDEVVEVSWEDKAEALIAGAAAASSPEESLSKYVAAILLADQNAPGDGRIAETWGDALQRIPGLARELWARLSGRVTSEVDVWEQISIAHQVNSTDADGDEALAISEAWGWVQVLRSGEVEAGKARLQAFAEGDANGYSAAILEAVISAESGNWRKVESEIKDRLAATGLDGEPLAAEVALRLADVSMGQAARDRAVEVLRRAQRSDPEHSSLRNRLTVLYRDTAKWNAYVDLLKEAVARTPDPEEQVSIYFEMIRIYTDQMHLEAMAVKAYESLLLLEPTNEKAIGALAAAYESSRRWPDLVSLLRGQADAAKSAARRVALNYRIAVVYLDNLSRQVDAIKAFEMVLEDSPYHEETIAHLKDLYGRRREWEKLIDVHKAEISRLADPFEQAERLKEVAEIADKLRQPSITALIWSEVLERSPKDEAALSALEGLYEREKDWPKLADICERKATLEEDPAEQLKLWTKLGGLYGSSIRDSEGAIRAWRAVLMLEPGHTKASDSLRKLLIDTKKWDDLETFYAEQDAGAELVRVLETLANTSKEDADVVELRFRAARVWRDDLGNPDRAVASLEKVFETDAANARAAAELAPHYESIADHAKLVAMLEIQHAAEDGLERRVELALKIATLNEKSLNDLAASYRWLASVIEQKPDHDAAYDAFERVGIQLDKAADVVKRYRDASSKVETEVERQELTFRMGIILANQLGKVDAALAMFESILEQEPDNLKALGALERILEQTGRFDELIQVNERRLGLATTPAEEAEILLSGARIHEQQRGDKVTAIESYERVRELAPKNQAALIELHRLYKERGDWEAMANAIRARLALMAEAAPRPTKRVEHRSPVQLDEDGHLDAPAGADLDEDADGNVFVVRVEEVIDETAEPQLEASVAIPLWMELGSVVQHELAEYDEAIGCYRRIMETDIENEAAQEALETLLGEGIEAGRVATILEPVYAFQADFDALVKVLSIQLEHNTVKDQQIVLWTRVAGLQRDELGDQESAFEAYGKALELLPADDEVFGQLSSVAAGLDDIPRLAAKLESITESIEDERLRTSYELRLAGIYETSLDDIERSRDFARSALQRGGKDPAVLESLEALHTRTESWDDLLAVLSKQKGRVAEEPERVLALNLRIASVKEELLQDPEGAIEVYLEVLNADGANEQALAALDRLYADLERWDEAASNLGRRLELQETEAGRDAVHCQLAKVLDRHLGESERAIEIYTEVLGRDSQNATAILDLEAMLETADPIPAESIMELLLPLYDAAGDWRKRAWVNEKMLRVVDDTQRRVALLAEIANLHESQGQEYEEAFIAYSRAHTEDPTDENTLEQLRRYAEALDVWRELVEVMQTAAETIADGTQAKEAQIRIASIYRDNLADLEGATTAYERASEYDPEDTSILDSLETIYRERSAWEPLTAVLAKKAVRCEDLTEKKEYLFQAAILCEEMLERMDRATEMYQEVLSLDSEDRTAIDSLERLYLSTERWNDLMSIYNIKIEAAQTPEQQLELYYIVGALQERELDDNYGAIETYRKVLDINSDDPHGLEALDRLYTLVEDWMNLLEILEREEATASDPDAKLELRFRQGDVWRLNLNESLRAIEVYRSVLEVHSAHEASIAALEAVIASGENGVDAAKVLEPVYKSAAEWEKLVAVYEVMFEQSEDEQGRIELLSTIAMIREDMQGDAAAAFDVWIRALHQDPRDATAWETLQRIAAVMDLWDTLVSKGGEILAKTEESDAASIVASHLARIYEENIGSPTDAISMWGRVLEVEPAEPTAIAALDGLYERQAMWPQLAETLSREIELATREEDILRFRLRLGTLYENFLEDLSEAISCYNEMLMLQAGNADAVASLERMFAAGQEQLAVGGILEPFYRDTEQWDNLVGIALALLEHFETATERYQKLLDIAEIYLGPLSNAANALFVYGRALVERPGDEFALTRLSELAEITQSWEEAVDFLAAALDASEEPTVQRELLWRMATAYNDEIGNFEQAEHAYLRVFEVDPEALDAMQALDKLYLEQSRWDDLVNVLRHEIALSQGDHEKIELYLRLGQIYEDMIQNSAAAVQSFRLALELEPSQSEALAALERIHMQSEEWELLYAVYSQQSTIADSEEVRSEIWAKMANLAAEVLDRRNDAIELWFQVLDARGADLNALQNLERLFEYDKRWPDMTDVIERQVPLVQTAEAQLELFRKLGRIWSGPLENEERALEYWRRAMDVHQEDLETLCAIKQIDENLGDYEDLVDIIRRIVALGVLEHEVQLAHYVQLGEILSQVLIRSQEAIDTWIQVLQLNPAHLQALVALEQLYVDEARWEEAVDVLDRKADVVEDSNEALNIRMQIAEIWENQVGNAELAAAAYDNVLDMDPANNDAFLRLETLHTNGENWQQLLGLYVTRAEVIEEPKTRLEVLRRAASIAEERLDQPEMAFVVLQTALADHWRDSTIANELERLADVTRNWRELVGIYEQIIETVKDPSEALELHNNVARWYFHKLNDNEKSWQHFQFVLSLDPNNLNALAALSKIYERLGSWQELVNVLVRRAELTQEVEDKIELYTQIAVVWEDNLSNEAQAIEAFRQVLALDEGNLNALRQLERIFQGTQQWEELVDVLETLCQVVYEPADVVKMRYRVGEIWETCLEVDQKAIDSYRQVLTIEETHAPALDALERLFTRLQQWADLIGVYEAQLTSAESGDEQIALYLKMATVYEEEFGDVENSIACMQRITMVDPANLMAIQTLERLYRDNGRWPDLIDALTTHISIVYDRKEQIELYRQLGEVFRDHLQDVYRAIESFRNILEIDPNHSLALGALADLYYNSADWQTCIETLNRLVAVTFEVADGVELQYRIGKIFEEHLAEYDQAEERFQIALDLDGSFMPAIDALQQLYERREDFIGVIRILKQKVEHTVDLEEKADLLCLIGQIYDLRMNDAINAVDYYEKTLQLSPSNIYAARPLAEKFIREQRWARAETLLETLIHKIGYSRDVEDLYMLHYWLGLASQELGQQEKSLTHFRESYELNQAYLPTLLGLGRQLYNCHDYERAYKMFQTILVQYAEELSGEQLIQVYFDSAQIKHATGDMVQSQHLFEKVLEIDPTHEKTLGAMIELCEDAENWEYVVYYKRARLSVAGDVAEKFAELAEMAEIYQRQMGDLEKAISCFREAMEIEPDSKFVMLKLLDIYTNSKQWTEAITLLDRLCELESGPERLAKFNYTIGVIYRDELNQDLQAVTYFNRTLDANINELKAFEAIDRILTAMKDWRELERNYRKMIKRVYDLDEGQFDDTKFLLWYGLAEIYRTRLTEWDSAISAFQQASSLRPKDPRMHRILADLFVRSGDQDDAAIGEFKTLINMPPDPSDPYARGGNLHERNAEFYHSLFKLYLKTKRYDEAWCICNVMCYLRIATDEEKQFNERYLGPSLVQAQGRLTPDTWKMVYHPDENLRIGNVLNVIQAYCRDLFAYDLKKTWSLKKKDELDQNADFLFCKMYRYLAQVIGVVPAPKLFLKRDQALGMINGNIDPPGFIVGADMMQGRGQRELGFIIARQLALATPIHYLGGLRLPTENLRFLVMGAIQAATNAATADSNLDAVIKAIHKMPPPVKVDLGKILKPIIEGTVEVNMSRWLKAIDNTSNRVGLLLCGDVEVAMSAIKNDPTPISKLTIPEKEAELLQFAISEEFFQVRARLGLSIA